MSTEVKVLEITTGGRPKAHVQASQKLSMAQFVAGGASSPNDEIKLQVVSTGSEADAQTLFTVNGQVTGIVEAKADGTLNLGRSGKTLTVKGHMQVDGNITVTGTQTVVSTVTTQGATNIGNDTADTVAFVARMSSDLDMDGDTRSIGSTARRVLNLYVADQSGASGVRLGNAQDMTLAYSSGGGGKGLISFSAAAVTLVGKGLDVFAGNGGAASGAAAGTGGVANFGSGSGGVAAGGYAAGIGGQAFFQGGKGGNAIAGAGNTAQAGGQAVFQGGSGGAGAGTNNGAGGGVSTFQGGFGGSMSGAGQVSGPGGNAALRGGSAGNATSSATQGAGGDVDIQGGSGSTPGAVRIATEVNNASLTVAKAGLVTALQGGLSVAEVSTLSGELRVEGAALRLSELGADPGSVGDKGFVYTKDVAGVTELFYRGAGGSVIQVTSGASLNVGSISFSLQEAYADGAAVAMTASKSLEFTTFDTAASESHFVVKNVGGSNYLKANAANGAQFLELGAATIGIKAMAHIQPSANNTMDLGGPALAFREAFARKVTSDGSLVLSSSATSDLTVDSARDLILELTASRTASAKFAVGGTSYLTFDTTNTKMVASQVMEHAANITFDEQTRQINGIEVQDLYSSVQAHTSGNVTAAKLVYFDSADSKVKHADADVYGQSVGLYGVAMATVADTVAVRVATGHGIAVGGFSGLTVGATYYLSQTAGDITTTAPTDTGSCVVRVGVAKSATVLMFAPQFLFEN